MVANEKNEATQQFQRLIRQLAEINLETEVRAADDSSIFVFVKAKDDQDFADVVYRSRIRDWLNGVRQIQPVKETVQTLTELPLSPAERLRLIYAMITDQKMDGGANITPKFGEWKYVDAIFPLHDHEKNKKWLSDFSKKTFLTPEDLDHIRDAVGEKVREPFDVWGSLLTLSDCLLLCLSPIILPIPDLPCSIWLLSQDIARKLLTSVHDRNWHLVCYLRRILETTRA